MPADTQQILDAADKVGQMVAEHPAVERYQQAQKALSEDPDATRLLTEFNRQIMTLSRQEETGLPVSDAQRQQLENMQMQLASHLKVKALNLAQVEYVNLLRQVTDAIRSKVEGQQQPGRPQSAGAAGAGAGGGPRIVM